ncbi:MAG TPA: hypothetical protein VFU73_15660 [Actinocrinis sp.]|nr:hypothetical protein [Actinocrinis sp.]
MSWIVSLAAALFSALRYELARVLAARSARTVGLLSLLGSALITLPAARSAVGLAHSQAAEIARLSGARLTLDRGGMLASFGGGRFMTVRPDAVIGRTISVPAAWLRHGSGMSGSAKAASAVVGRGGAHVLAHGTGVGTGTGTGAGGLGHAASLAAAAGAHAGGAGVVAGGVVGAVLPAAMAALAAAWVGASSIVYEYRDGGALITYVLVPRRGAVLLAKAIVAALFGAVLCFGTTLAAFGTARLGFGVAGTRIDVPSELMVPAAREVAIAALCGALAVPACAVLRTRLLAVPLSLAGGALVAATLPGSTSPLIHFLGTARRFLAAYLPSVPEVSIRSLIAAAAGLLWVSALVAVRRRRVG